MAARIALVFVGIVLAGVFLTLYYFMFSVVAVAALGIENKLVLDAAYWLCLAAGIVTTYYILRGSWSPSANARTENTKSVKQDSSAN